MTIVDLPSGESFSVSEGFTKSLLQKEEYESEHYNSAGGYHG